MHPSDAVSVICLTPIKNEAWILERFLQSASLWADHIIIADQQSDDGSREIAARFPKVRLIDNNTPAYDEQARQQLLLDAARTIPGPRLLIALDADEFFTPDGLHSAEWEAIKQAAPGTVIRFRWVNIHPNLRQYWEPADDMPFGFADDSSPHTGREIHSTRIPYPPDAPVMDARTLKVMHYQYTDWERMESKHRWYQAWERIQYPTKRTDAIYRMYHRMYAIRSRDLHAIPSAWFTEYEERGIAMRRIQKSPFHRWDVAMLRFFQQHGTAYFAKEAIWHVDWVDMARRWGIDNPEQFTDPRTVFEKAQQHWFRATRSYRDIFPLRVADRLLGALLQPASKLTRHLGATGAREKEATLTNV